MDRTVFIYTSDHGYHSGQWGVAYCKMLSYEEDVRIPMFVRLPGSAAGGARAGGGASSGGWGGGRRAQAQQLAAFVIHSAVLNIDLAPALLDLAGYDAPQMDGQSFLPLLKNSARGRSSSSSNNNNISNSNNSNIRSRSSTSVSGGEVVGVGGRGGDGELRGDGGRTFLIEYWPIPHNGNDVQTTTKGVDGWCTDPDVLRTDCPALPVQVDSVNNTWACARTISPPFLDTVFCLFGTRRIGTLRRFPASPNLATLSSFTT